MELFHNFVTKDKVPGANVISSKELFQRMLTISERQSTGVRIGWFDGEGIWNTASFGGRKEMEQFCQENGIMVSKKWSGYNTVPGMVDGTRIQMVFMASAVNSLRDGMTIGDLVERYNTLLDSEGDYEMFHKKYGLRHRKNPFDGYDIVPSAETKQFITKVNAPVIERYSVNHDTDTFDLVRIRLGIRTLMPKKEQANFAKRHLTEIVSVAKRRINESRSYQRFGVPPEFLKLDHAGITNQSEIELVFVLPEIE